MLFNLLLDKPSIYYQNIDYNQKAGIRHVFSYFYSESKRKKLNHCLGWWDLSPIYIFRPIFYQTKKTIFYQTILQKSIQQKWISGNVVVFLYSFIHTKIYTVKKIWITRTFFKVFLFSFFHFQTCFQIHILMIWFMCDLLQKFLSPFFGYFTWYVLKKLKVSTHFYSTLFNSVL